MNAARTGVERDVVGEDERRNAVVEGMLRERILELFALAGEYRLAEFKLRRPLHLGLESLRDEVYLIADLIEAVIVARMDGHRH